MGVCCTRLDSIEHAHTIEDLNYIINIDKEMFKSQLTLVEQDKILTQEIKTKKVNYFKKVVEKYASYHEYFNKLEVKLNDVEIYEVKLKYKKMTKEISSLQYSSQDEIFNSFEEFLFKFT